MSSADFRKVLDALKRAISIHDILGLPRGFMGAIPCPHPEHDDKTPSFYIYGPQNAFCYGAGHPWDGARKPLDVIDIVMMQKQCGFIEALRELSERSGINIGDLKLGTELSPEELRSRERQSALQECYGLVFNFTKGVLLDELPGFELPEQAREEAARALKFVSAKYGWSNETLRSWPIGYWPNHDGLFFDYLESVERERGAQIPALVEDALVASGLFTNERWQPLLKGRLVMGYGERFYCIGRLVDGVSPAFKPDAKYLKPYAPAETRPEVWEEASQPLLVSPETHRNDGILIVSSPWQPRSDVVVAEGIPDAISAWQAGYPTVSAVTTHAAKGEQAETLLEVALSTTRMGCAIIFIPDIEKNRAGEDGMVTTAVPLLRAGADVRVALLHGGFDRLFGNKEMLP